MNIFIYWQKIPNTNKFPFHFVSIFIFESKRTFFSQLQCLRIGLRKAISLDQTKISPNRTTPFQVRNIRYLYNDPVSTATGFDGAFQLEAVKGSNQTLYLPLDTRSGSSIIEVGNTQSSEVTFDLTLFGPTGSTLFTAESTLSGHGSAHIIMDSLLPQTIGAARIAAQGSGKIIATVMQYGRTATAGINYLYGIHAKEPLGTVMRGSYNNFLSQGCRIILVNGSNLAQDASISMTRFDGTVVLNNQSVTLTGNGTVESYVCANDSPDTLGVVTVQPDTANSVTAAIVRYGSGDSYRFPTAVR